MYIDVHKKGDFVFRTRYTSFRTLRYLSVYATAFWHGELLQPDDEPSFQNSFRDNDEVSSHGKLLLFAVSFSFCKRASAPSRKAPVVTAISGLPKSAESSA